MIIEIEEEPGSQLIAAFVVYHYFLFSADSPGLKVLFHLCIRYSSKSIGEQVVDVDADGAGNMLLRVGFRRGIEYYHIGVVEIFCKPANVDKIASHTFFRECWNRLCQ